LMIFSFYPTKPIGSCDGGMIVSNNRHFIEELRILTFNGMDYSNDSWQRKIKTVGHKMYMNSIQAYMANENLKKLDEKNNKLKEIRNEYNNAFQLTNTSNHLYRIHIKNDRNKFIKQAKENGFYCGIHYKALHTNKLYSKRKVLLKSEKEQNITVSIPFHEKLKQKEINKIIKFVNEYKKK
jgi:perosamine synthetase